jgi:O-antigen/teichoic acid export membrane protein
MLVWAGNRQAVAFIQVRVAILLLSVLVGVFLVRRLVGLQVSLTTTKQSLRSALPYAASDFLAYASMRLDITIVALTIGEYYVGLYSPAVNITNALYLIPAAVYVVMVPVLSKLFIANPYQAWQSARRFTQVLVLVGIGSFAGLAVAAKPFVSILGASFSGSEEILQILSVILLFKSGTFAMAGILVSVGRQAQRTIVQAIAVAFNTVLNLIVVYRAGIYGVALVYVATEIILLVGYSLLVQRYRVKYTAPLANIMEEKGDAG